MIDHNVLKHKWQQCNVCDLLKCNREIWYKNIDMWIMITYSFNNMISNKLDNWIGNIYK